MFIGLVKVLAGNAIKMFLGAKGLIFGLRTYTKYTDNLWDDDVADLVEALYNNDIARAEKEITSLVGRLKDAKAIDNETGVK